MKSTGTATTRVGRPSKAAQDAASEKIMAVAMELFAGRGFAGTSMEQVASRCGMGKDTLYRRFPSKVALFEAVVEHAHRRAVERLADMRSAAEEPLPRLKALMQEMLHMNMDADLIALKRITFSETVVFEKSEPFPRQPDPIMDRLIDAVRAAQAAGSIRAEIPLPSPIISYTVLSLYRHRSRCWVVTRMIMPLPCRGTLRSHGFGSWKACLPRLKISELSSRRTTAFCPRNLIAEENATLADLDYSTSVADAEVKQRN